MPKESELPEESNDRFESLDPGYRFEQINGSDIASTAEIDSTAIIGEGSRIGPETSIGENTTIGATCRIEKTRIGARTKVGRNSQIFNSSIGDQCEIGEHVDIDHTEIGDYSFIEGDAKIAEAKLGKGVFVNSRDRITGEFADGAIIGAHVAETNPENLQIGEYAESWDGNDFIIGQIEEIYPSGIIVINGFLLEDDKQIPIRTSKFANKLDRRTEEEYQEYLSQE